MALAQIAAALSQRGLRTTRGGKWYSATVRLVLMREAGCPVVFDATHSVQLPGGMGDRSGGQREFVHPLARAAVAVGVSGLFMECHPDPEQALSDGPNAVPLADMARIITNLLQLQQASADAR